MRMAITFINCHVELEFWKNNEVKLLKNRYKNFGNAFDDMRNDVLGSKTKALTFITNEFVKKNEAQTPEDTRALINSIKLNTQYSEGLVIASTHYAKKVYYTKMNFQKSSATNYFFEKTWEKNKNTFKEQYIAYIKKQF